MRKLLEAVRQHLKALDDGLLTETQCVTLIIDGTTNDSLMDWDEFNLLREKENEDATMVAVSLWLQQKYTNTSTIKYQENAIANAIKWLRKYGFAATIDDGKFFILQMEEKGIKESSQSPTMFLLAYAYWSLPDGG